jgi:hypothetical protein
MSDPAKAHHPGRSPIRKGEIRERAIGLLELHDDASAESAQQLAIDTTADPRGAPPS